MCSVSYINHTHHCFNIEKHQMDSRIVKEVHDVLDRLNLSPSTCEASVQEFASVLANRMIDDGVVNKIRLQILSEACAYILRKTGINVKDTVVDIIAANCRVVHTLI
jgi:predicted nucleic acid-binding protein